MQNCSQEQDGRRNNSSSNNSSHEARQAEEPGLLRRLPRCKYQVCLILAVRHWKNYLTSLGFHPFTYKLQMIIYLLQGSGLKDRIYEKCLEQYLALGRHCLNLANNIIIIPIVTAQEKITYIKQARQKFCRIKKYWQKTISFETQSYKNLIQLYQCPQNGFGN